MSFGTNLQALRRRNNMTQEGLADALGVSRQSVSKWESDGSFPEMDKLLQLCDLFGCSLDALVRGSVGDGRARTEDAADAQASEREAQAAAVAYDRHMRSGTRLVTCSTGLVLAGIAVLLLLQARFPGNVAALVGTALLLGCIAAAAAMCIVFGCRHAAFERRYPSIPRSPYPPAQVEQFERRFPWLIAGGTVLALLGVILLVCSPLLMSGLQEEARSSLATGLFLLILAAAAMLLVYGGMTWARYHVGDAPVSAQAADGANDAKANAPGRDWEGAIMLVATALFLLLGFVFHLWHPGWVVFPIGGILCGIVSSLRGRG